MDAQAMSDKPSIITLPRVAIAVAIAAAAVVGGFALAGLGKSQLGLGKADAEQADSAVAPEASEAPEPAAVAEVDSSGAPAAYVTGLAELNSERQAMGVAPVVWSATLEQSAQQQLNAISRARCTFHALSKATATADGAATSFYRAHGLQQLDGASRQQDIKPALVFRDWLAGKAGFRTESGSCDGSDACRSWRILTAPAVHEIGCASLACDDGVQLWACRTGR